MARTLILGTRGSRLARWQTDLVLDALDVPAEVHVIRTAGDKDQQAALHEQGGAGFFTSELEAALRDRAVDVAVHSLKDLPVVLADGLVLGALMPRADVEDLLLVRPDALDPRRPFPVREGARVGTSAMRRQGLLARYRPDLRPVPVRGNVPTRIRKAAEAGCCDALLMARAGIARLGLDVAPLVPYDLNPHRWVPAPGQAAIAVEVRGDDADAVRAAAALDHAPTRAAIDLERGLLQAAGGGCHTAFAAWQYDATTLHLAIPSADGLVVARLTGDDLRATALAWLADPVGRPVEAEEGWLAQPARPW